MAFPAVSCIVGLESLCAVMALAAILACIHVCHGVRTTLLHREDLRVAVIALQSFVCMSLAIKYDLTCAAACELHGLSGRHSKCTTYECYDNKQSNKQYRLLHIFTPFQFLRFCFLTKEHLSRLSATS